MRRATLVFALLLPSLALTAPRPAHAIELCKGGKRAERKVTCIVDGDTIWQAGNKLRLLDIDAPETGGAECPAERQRGHQATLRLQALMSDGYAIRWSGRGDRTSSHRQLVRIKLKDGRDAGKALLREGLAQPWPNKGNIWCGK